MPRPRRPERTPPADEQEEKVGLERLEKKDGRIGAYGEKAGCSEIDVAGISAKDVPRRGQHNVLKDNVRREIIVLVLHQTGENESRRNDGDGQCQKKLVFQKLPPKQA